MSRGELDGVYEFWFGAPAASRDELLVKVKRWYMGGPSVDREITERWADLVERALRGELEGWLAEPRGLVSLIIALDQFPRSAFRGTARAFAGAARAEELALGAFDSGQAHTASFEERHFLLMPLLHAESVPLLERCVVESERHVALSPDWAREVVASAVEQANKYLGVVRRFGRFPHRNAALGRQSTPEELEFLVEWEQAARPKLASELR